MGRSLRFGWDMCCRKKKASMGEQLREEFMVVLIAYVVFSRYLGQVFSAP